MTPNPISISVWLSAGFCPALFPIRPTQPEILGGRIVRQQQIACSARDFFCLILFSVNDVRRNFNNVLTVPDQALHPRVRFERLITNRDTTKP